MKRLLALLLALVMCLSMFACGDDKKDKKDKDEEDTTVETTEATTEEITEAPVEKIEPDKIIESGDFEIAVYGDKATITRYLGNSSSAVIPSEIEGYKITAIGDCAFNLCILQSIEIPNSVTAIGERAFESW